MQQYSYVLGCGMDPGWPRGGPGVTEVYKGCPFFDVQIAIL